MKFIKISGYFLLVIFLTILTQVGGIVLLICLPVFKFIKRKFKNRLTRRILRPVSFLAIYFFVNILVVPPLATALGRIPLPVFSNDNLKPLSLYTCILNRHYVTPELYKAIEEVADEMNKLHPGSIVTYLDANFPFINKFPLAPHLSHSDGKKIDIAFFYTDKETGVELSNTSPSIIGYGVYEGPEPNEKNRPLECANSGYWQYGVMEKILPQGRKETMNFDPKRTKELIRLLNKNESIGRMFLEPHLKTRMNLNCKKIGYHGCGAVRHDDHIHVQLW